MSASKALAVLFTFALAACGGDAPTAPGSTASTTRTPEASALRPGVAAAHGAAPTKPMAGSCRATYAEAPVFTPPFLRHVSTGTCQLTHLGRVSLRTVAQVNTATGVQTAETTYRAANGDLLYATSIGTGTPTGPGTLRFEGTTTIAGGTGRFEHATGQLNVEGTSNTVTGDASFSYDGWIAYDASDRRSR